MKATVYRNESNGYLYVKIIKSNNDEKYYAASKHDKTLSPSEKAREFTKKLLGKPFEFVSSEAIDEKNLTPAQLAELKIAAETAWVPEKQSESPKVPEPAKEPPTESQENKKIIRTYINKDVGEKVYADLNSSKKAQLHKSIKDAIQRLGYEFFEIAGVAGNPPSFRLDNNANGFRIMISTDGVMTLDTSNENPGITPKDTENAIEAIKQTYKVLGVQTDQYTFDAKLASGLAGVRHASSPANIKGGYHHYLKTYTNAINKLIEPHGYKVDPNAATLVATDGRTVAVNDDGSTSGKLFSDLNNPTTAQDIAKDHIAVIKMHLALMQQGIMPAEKIINLFLIQKNLSDAQKAHVPALQAKIKELIEAEFKKNEYNDIRAMIRYEGQPLFSSSTPSLTISGSKITLEKYRELHNKLTSPVPGMHDKTLDDIIKGNSDFFEFIEPTKDNNGGFRFKAGVEEAVNKLAFEEKDPMKPTVDATDKPAHYLKVDILSACEKVWDDKKKEVPKLDDFTLAEINTIKQRIAEKIPKPSAPPAEPTSVGNQNFPTITKESFLTLVRNLEDGDLSTIAQELQNILDGNSPFFGHSEDLNPNGSYYGEAGYYLKPSAKTTIRALGLTKEDIAFSTLWSGRDHQYPDTILTSAISHAVVKLGGNEKFVEALNLSQERDLYLRGRIQENLPKNSSAAPHTASVPKPAENPSTFTKQTYLNFCNKLTSPDPKISAHALKDIIEDQHECVGFRKATDKEIGGFYLKEGASEKIHGLGLKRTKLRERLSTACKALGFNKDPSTLRPEDDRELQDAIGRALNPSPGLGRK